MLEPKLDFVRTVLDTNIVPGYVTLILAVEQNQLDQLYLERPQLIKQEKTPWDHFLDMLAVFVPMIEEKAARELFYRVGPKEENLRAALAELEGYDYITVKTINKHFAPKDRVYAIQVVRAFLAHNDRYKWKLLNRIELEIGTEITFYAMRKALRKIFREKRKYLNNEDTSEWGIQNFSMYDVILLYALFETATNYNQLYPILNMFERRQLPDVSSQ